MESSSSKSKNLKYLAKQRRTKKKRKGFMVKKVADNSFELGGGDETSEDIDFYSVNSSINTDTSNVNTSVISDVNTTINTTVSLDTSRAVIEVQEEDISPKVHATVSHLCSSPTKTSKYKRYRQLVNRSKLKLSSSKLFTVKTRSQFSKLIGENKHSKTPAEGYKLVDVQLLQKILETCVVCKFCRKKQGKVDILQDGPRRKGLAESLVFRCRNCRKETKTFTSKRAGTGVSAFDVNLRATYASQPFGREGLARSCSTMDLPPPLLNDSYTKISHQLGKKCEEVAEKAMKVAASRILHNTMDTNPDKISVLKDGTSVAGIAVSLDGTWQKRGHNSKNGVVFLISVDSGEVLDYSVKSQHCGECDKHQNNKETERYKRWHEMHAPKCSRNYEGSSGGMEAAAGVEIFLRSMEKNNLQYTTFVGDGDSSCFSKVKEALTEKYGEMYQLTKEKCTGHVQKRMGSGLREYKRKQQGIKLDDGKGVGGTGRLTDAIIDRIQNNYGQAIRSNKDVESMRTAIQAVLHHMAKDDNKTLVDQHKFCPKDKDTWCKFWQAEIFNVGVYSEDGRLPAVFKNELESLFERLSNPKLLERCLKNLNQNQNGIT